MTALSLRVGFGFGPKTLPVSRAFLNCRGIFVSLRKTGTSGTSYSLSVAARSITVIGETVVLGYTPASGTPAAPLNVRIGLQGQSSSNSTPSPPTPPLPNQQTVLWDAVSGATSYNVYRSTNGGSYSVVGTPSTNSYQDLAATLCVNGTAGSGPDYYVANVYRYKISAIVGSVEGPLSDTQKCVYYANGVQDHTGGDFNLNATTDYASTTGAPQGGHTLCMKMTTTGAFGDWIPWAGNNATQWNLAIGAYGYLAMDVKAMQSGSSLQLVPIRVGDVPIQNSGGTQLVVQSSTYATLVNGSWVRVTIPLSVLMLDYTSGTPTQLTAWYKTNVQNNSSNVGDVFYFDNVEFIPPTTRGYVLPVAKKSVPVTGQAVTLTYSHTSGFTPQANFTVTPDSTFTHGAPFTVNSALSALIARGNYNPSTYTWNGNQYTCYLAKSFEDGQYQNNGLAWNTGGAVWDVVTSTTVTPPTNLTKCARQRGQTSRQGELQMFPSTNPAELYVGYKFRLGSTYNGKHWRSWGSADSIYFATNGTSAGGSDLTGSNNEAQDVFSSPDSFTSGWNHVEYYNKLLSSIQVQTMLNCKNQWNRTGSTWSPGNLSGHTLDLGNLLEVGDTGYWADYFIDFINLVFYIHDNSVLSSSTKREFQVPINSGTTSSWRLALNQGEFTSLSGLYLSAYNHTTQTQQLIGQFS